jgi:uncharacterized protein (TIGR02996 family)
VKTGNALPGVGIVVYQATKLAKSKSTSNGLIVNEHETLLAAVLADPADDTTRLVLADLLRESDDATDRALGQFIWAGVTISPFREDRVIDDPLYYTAQKALAAVASAGFPARWLSALGLGPQHLAKSDWLWDNTLDQVTVRMGGSSGVFKRGMLTDLCVPLENWYTAAPAALAHWPLASGTITDVPGLAFAIGLTKTGWRLSARLRLRSRRVPMTAAGVVPTAVAEQAFLVEEAGDVETWDLFPDRAALISALASRSAELVTELREEVGERWPSPPRRS